MSRFSRRPCTVCKEDTMHYVAKCSVCGNAISLAHPIGIANKRIRARAYERAGGDQFITGAILRRRQLKMTEHKRELAKKNGYVLV